MEICKKEQCTGCCACYNICPKNCIAMCEDAEGFRYPVVDEKLCIHCDLCKKSCPANLLPNFKNPKATYAAWSKDVQEQKTSTSGGVASTFARIVVDRGGVVFGAAYGSDLSVQHTGVCDHAGVDRLKGSKYIQSNIGNTLKEVKKQLAAGKEVLFIGTPCQVGGLNNYIGKSAEGLTTVDLVCHGTPSHKVLKLYISALENKYGFTADAIGFRNAKGYYLELFEKGKPVYSKQSLYDLYYIGFLRGLFPRPSCNSCTYAQEKRCSDITIGDFWGLGKTEPFAYDTSNGISLCMANTEKGADFLEKTHSVLNLEQRETAEAVAGNKQLRAPTPKHKERERFFKLMRRKGVKPALAKVLWKEKLGYRAVDLLNKIRK